MKGKNQSGYGSVSPHDSTPPMLLPDKCKLDAHRTIHFKAACHTHPALFRSHATELVYWFSQTPIKILQKGRVENRSKRIES